MGRITQGLPGYAFALVVCLAGAGLFLLATPRGRADQIPRADYRADQAAAVREAPYEIVVPRRVPPGWVPTSSALDGDGGAVTWRLGFATGGGLHAMIAQSDERPPGEFANRMANTDKASGGQVIDGVAWQERFRPDKDQRSLVRVLPDHTVVVTGTAGWDELAALARTLGTP
ncbi:DUF4245 domain-containing protein [Microbispora sp. NPDC049125]|uniref:DUF4245 domain-containing protein n=1 Tax=Microbispora sp. NPDC049125 TaxID=3154929 RepID=UPI003467B9F3